MTIHGLVGVVTGASGGLGRAITLSLAEQGATVYALARDERALEETKRLAEQLPGTVKISKVDVTDEGRFRSQIAEVSADEGRFDFIVNNAGWQVEKNLLDTSNEEWDAIQNTNSKGTFWGCKQAVIEMLAHGNGGSIVNIASVLSITADPLLPAYTTSKHAVLGLTRSIAVTREYATQGIRANAVLPGDMETPMVTRYFESHDEPEEARQQVASAYPCERISDPMEVARVARFLVSSDASFVNGASIVVDGGISASLYTS